MNKFMLKALLWYLLYHSKKVQELLHHQPEASILVDAAQDCCMIIDREYTVKVTL